MGIPASSRNKAGTIQDWGIAALIKHNGRTIVFNPDSMFSETWNEAVGPHEDIYPNLR